MGRPLKPFSQNIELQNLIIQDRVDGMTISAIAEKYPQYSEVTYKRFLASKQIKPNTNVRATDEYKNHQKEAQKKAWENRDPQAKEKHIQHLRSLAESRRGVPIQHSDEWHLKNQIHIKKLHEKYSEIMLSRYGVYNSSHLESVKEARRRTFIKNYGVESYFLSDEFKAKNKSSSSKGELELLEFVLSLGVSAEKGYIGGKEIDIIAKSAGVGVEYNGLYYHSERSIPNNYHAHKSKIARAHGIRLIHVFGNEWHHKKDQVKSYLKSALGKNERKIGARKCSIRVLERDQASEFLEKYHIQGKCLHITAFGLEHDGELLSVLTVGRHHRRRGVLVVNRFCCKDGWTVSGGLSRLSKAAYKHFKEPLVSWCDLRWSNGAGYLAAGWKRDQVLKPDYFYTNFRKVFSKQSRRKKAVNTPEGMTEHEHALLDGLYRVYDCGKIRFIYPGNTTN